MIIDLSKLSPRCRRLVCDEIRRVVEKERRDMDYYLEQWANRESLAYKEMVNWRNACMDVESQAFGCKKK